MQVVICVKPTIVISIFSWLSAFLQDLESNRRKDIGESVADSSKLPLPDDEDDVTDYKFSKFAATYFQNNATSTYIRRVLKQPLLPLKNEGDQLVICCLLYSIYY